MDLYGSGAMDFVDCRLSCPGPGKIKTGLPLPDPPLLPVEGKTPQFSPGIPREIKVFSDPVKRGVGQGQYTFFRAQRAMAARKNVYAAAGPAL